MMFVPDTPTAPLVWQVCFIGNDRKRFWDLVLAPGYRHAFLLGYLPGRDLWLCYEVLFGRTEISVMSPAVAAGILGLAVRQGGVLSWPAPGPQKPSPFPRFGFWCVPAILHVLGLGCVAVTPRGLHDYLKRRGASPLVEDLDEPIQHAENQRSGP